jgi:hypothetical protein
MHVACEAAWSFFEKGHARKRVYRRGFGNRCRATPRADIWIPRPRGSVCREKIDKPALIGGYCTCFLLFLDCGFPDTPPEERAVNLIVLLRWRVRGGQRITPLPHREDMQNMQNRSSLLFTTLINISLREPARDSIAQESVTP